jgi:hypothetical protein
MKRNVTDMIWFEERQKLRQTWIWAILLSAFFLPLVLNFIFWETSQFSKKDFIQSVAILLPLELVVVALLYLAELRIRVTEEGLWLGWYPFQMRGRLIRKEDIKALYLRKAPLLQFGWRWVPTYGWVYRLVGESGIQVTKTNNRKIFVSTRNLNAFRAALEKLTDSNISGYGEKSVLTDRF